MNNLADSILNSKVAMFADDTKVYKEVKSEDDGAALQKDVDNLYSWSAASGLAFNDKKCKLQTLRGSASPYVRATRLTAVPSSPVRMSLTLESPWTVT